MIIERVTGTATDAMLLQDEDLFTNFAQKGSTSQPTDSTADDDHNPLAIRPSKSASKEICYAIMAQNLRENMEKYVNPVVFSVLSTDLSLEGVWSWHSRRWQLIAATFIHPNYSNPGPNYNDVALLKVNNT